MIQALLHGKLSREQINAEDILTSNVFGLLQYVSAKDGLLPFLMRAARMVGNCSLEALSEVDSTESFEVKYCFWPRWQNCEPDLLVEVFGGQHRFLIVLEAKYLSGKSSIAFVSEETLDHADDREARCDGGCLANDQLAKQWYCLVEKAHIANAKPILIYLTAHFAYPKDEIDASVKDYQMSAPGSPHPTIYWLSWRELPRLFRGKQDKHLADIAKVAERLTLTYFEGINSDVSPLSIDWTFRDSFWRSEVDPIVCEWSFEK